MLQVLRDRVIIIGFGYGKFEEGEKAEVEYVLRNDMTYHLVFEVEVNQGDE